MILAEIWDYMEKEVFPLPSTPILFNQYKDSDENVDLQNAGEIRRNNLKKYLECFVKIPNFLVVAEAPGPWGVRFSGVPLSTEKQLCIDEFPIAGKQSSSNGPPYPRGGFSHAQTARIFWSVMSPLHPNFLAWNAIPFHPHKGENILSIRNPSKYELVRYSGLLLKVHSVLHPAKTIAVGKSAERAFKYIGIPSKSYERVRHPANGGQNEFREGINRILGSELLQS